MCKKRMSLHEVRELSREAGLSATEQALVREYLAGDEPRTLRFMVITRKSILDSAMRKLNEARTQNA